MKYLLAVLTLAFTSSVRADEIESIKLTNVDSANFKKVLVGFSNPETISDAIDPTKWSVTRRFDSTNKALKMICTTAFVAGHENFTECSIQFDPSNSSPELEVVRGVIGKAIAAKINSQQQASQINRNLGYISFVASEKVRVQLPSGAFQDYARIRVDCDQIANSGGAAKTCRIVAMPNQTID